MKEAAKVPRPRDKRRGIKGKYKERIKTNI
jgi:hypothetical protein